MQKPTIYILIASISAFIVYCFGVGPLRNAFDDRWPYINVFLASPGTAAKNIALIIGLGLSVQFARSGHSFAKMFALGISLILLAALMNSLYAAWAIDHRTELRSLIFDHPLRLAVWKWYFRIDVSQCFAAVGASIVVVAMTRSMRALRKAEFFGQAVKEIGADGFSSRQG